MSHRQQLAPHLSLPAALGLALAAAAGPAPVLLAGVWTGSDGKAYRIEQSERALTVLIPREGGASPYRGRLQDAGATRLEYRPTSEADLVTRAPAFVKQALLRQRYTLRAELTVVTIDRLKLVRIIDRVTWNTTKKTHSITPNDERRTIELSRNLAYRVEETRVDDFPRRAALANLEDAARRLASDLERKERDRAAAAGRLNQRLADLARAETDVATRAAAREETLRRLRGPAESEKTPQYRNQERLLATRRARLEQRVDALPRLEGTAKTAALAEVDRLRAEIPRLEAGLRALEDRLGLTAAIQRAAGAYPAADDAYWEARRGHVRATQAASDAEAELDFESREISRLWEQATEVGKSAQSLRAGEKLLKVWLRGRDDGRDYYLARAEAIRAESGRELEDAVEKAHSLIGPAEQKTEEALASFRRFSEEASRAEQDLARAVTLSGSVQATVETADFAFDLARAAHKGGPFYALIEAGKKGIEGHLGGGWSFEQARLPDELLLIERQVLGAAVRQTFVGEPARVLQGLSGPVRPGAAARLKALEERFGKVKSATSKLGIGILTKLGKDVMKRSVKARVAHYFEYEPMRRLFLAAMQARAAALVLHEAIGVENHLRAEHAALAAELVHHRRTALPRAGLRVEYSRDIPENTPLRLWLGYEADPLRPTQVSLGERPASNRGPTTIPDAGRTLAAVEYGIEARGLARTPRGGVVLLLRQPGR